MTGEVLAEEPVPVGRVEDAYLPALAEHLASACRIDAPAWTGAPHRFLREPYFAGGLELLKAILIVESPSSLPPVSDRLLTENSWAHTRPPASPAVATNCRNWT